jgi:ribonuclease D
MDSLPVEAEPVAPPPYAFVTAKADFQRMMEQLKASSRMAIDIEADSLYHYFEKVCLIQISTDSHTFIVDPLAVPDVGALAPLMRNPSKEKVFHAAGYDIYCLRRDYGFAFTNIYDTHIAAQLVGYKFLGLDTLMEEFLGVHHSKRNQRDDWSRRPLDPGQLNYAAMDTHHLLPLRDALEAELRLKGRLDWAREEFEAAASAERREKEFDPEGFRRIKGNRDLPLQDQIVLRALYIFRDEVARKMDVPPFKVLNNSVLLDLAKNPPFAPEQLFRRRGVSSRVARKYSTRIVNVIARAKKQNVSTLETPTRNNFKSPGRAAKHRLEKLRIWRNRRAEELGLQVGVAFPASLLEHVAAYPPEDIESLQRLPGMRQWRVREFGAELLQLFHNGEPRRDTSESEL